MKKICKMCAEILNYSLSFAMGFLPIICILSFHLLINLVVSQSVVLKCK